MGTRRVEDLMFERDAYNHRTFPQVPGMNKSAANGENVSPGLERTSGGQTKRSFTSSQARYRNVRPWTKGDEWNEGDDRTEYTEAIATVWHLCRGYRPDSRRGKLRSALAQYLTERKHAAKLADAGADARVRALTEHIAAEADFFGGVKTNDIDEAARLAQAARAVIGRK